MKTRLKLSVVLATFNEAENLTRCLRAIKDIANEIVIVDGSSTDDTVKIAKQYGAKVISTTNKPIFHINKQMAIDAATGDWILQLDADEVVSRQLAQEIKEVIAMDEQTLRNRFIPSQKKHLFTKHQLLLERRDGKQNAKHNETVAFFIPRRSYFLGRFLNYGGTYPDGVIRLIKKGRARFPSKSVHEQMEIDGRVNWLKNEILHYDSPTFNKYLVRANRYTSLTADELVDKKIPINFLTTIQYTLIKPAITFLSLFIRHKGFMDGFPGFVFALFSGLHHALAYMKYWELTRQANYLSQKKSR